MISNQNYKRTISANGSPQEAYLALTSGFVNWWTKPDRPITKIGDRAKFSFPPGASYWTFEATLLEPGKRVELECVEALHILEGQPKAIESEWLGSKAIWQIVGRGDQTDIHFEHVGLTQRLHCYEICEAGWDMFFCDSLKAFLDTGQGAPYKPQKQVTA